MSEKHWAWCETCQSYIGAEPPLLHPYWPATKTKWMHEGGTGHKVELRGLEVLADFARMAEVA